MDNTHRIQSTFNAPLGSKTRTAILRVPVTRNLWTALGLAIAIHCIQGTNASRNGIIKTGVTSHAQKTIRFLAPNVDPVEANGQLPEANKAVLKHHQKPFIMVLPDGSPTVVWDSMELERQKDRPIQGLSDFMRQLFFDIGGGTGATIGTTGDKALDHVLMRRMRYQDKAVMVLLLLAYLGSLAFSASIAYRQANNNSPTTYYADPRYHNAVVDNHDLDSFLQAFNQPPKDVQLQITGLLPFPNLPEYLVDSAIEWLGVRYRVAFSFALDLSPWVVRHGDGNSLVDAQRLCNNDDATHEIDLNGGTTWSAADGVSREDLDGLQNFLTNNKNDLAVVELRKEVEWPQWEELATNIKQKIRQRGFTGAINVHRRHDESMIVYKNRPWANFMHSRTTKVVCALSAVGWLIYQPYMWVRHRPYVLHSRYRVDVTIDNFWLLISDKIGADGFDSGSNVPQAF